MTKSKKLSMFIFSLLLVVASLLFVACGTPNYSNVTISSSQETVELFINEENSQNVTFTINNPPRGMESSLDPLQSDDGIYSATLLSTSGYSSTYNIVGLKGGESNFTVKTREGDISHTIKVLVRQYSDELTAGNNSLYVSPSTQFIPSSADFIFSDNTTERNLEYYFYGNANTRISLDDITESDLLTNSFVKVNLINLDNNQYMIFQDSQGNLHTLGKAETVVGSSNIKYNFIDVEYSEGEYVFNINNATSVLAGDKFTFIAVNNTLDELPLYCQRDFYVLIDINSNSITHDFGYRIDNDNYEYTIGSDYLYKLNDSIDSEITLVPSYKNVIQDGIFVGETVDYVTVYLEVSLQSQSELLQVNVSTLDFNVINTKGLGKLTENGITTYYYQIDCATNQENETNFNITFYYDGFEDSNDSNVNFTYSIPVKTKIIPTNILVNDIDLANSEQIFTFYDSYAGDSFGWQQFLFTLNPEDAEYDYLLIDLTDTDLRLRYNNTVYENQVVKINDLSEPIYLKGASGAQVTTEIRTLPIQLNFNVLQEGNINVNFLYEIVKGATILDFSTDEYRERLYLDINGGEVPFTDIYADAQFNDIEITKTSGSDVAKFIIGDNLYIQQGTNYYLNLTIRPIALGNGTYTIILDNGKQISVTISVEESLNNVSISSQNQQNAIKYNQEFIEDTRSSTLLYVYNSGTQTYFDVQVIANGNANSNAINSIQFSFTSQLIRLGEATNNNKNFNVYIIANGTSTLQLAVSGYKITNFIRENITLLYYIDIVGFNYIENLNVYKERDGKGEYIDFNSDNDSVVNYGINAAYADVYSGTNNTQARSAKFNVIVDNVDAYLFAIPQSIENGNNLQYIQSTFNQDYIYWETDWSYGITKDGQSVDIMYYDAGGSNIYTLTGVGTFDTSTMTFTSLSSLKDPRDFKIIAHVRQYGRVYSYTINVRISIYEEVSYITFQEDITSIEFTSNDRVHSLIAYPSNLTATNGEIVAFFEGGGITVSNSDGTSSTYYMLDENDIEYVVSDGRTQIILKVSDEFVKYAEKYQDEMRGELIIVARDWLDENGNILSTYENVTKRIDVFFKNGTEKNRFTLKNADDLVNMNLSAHYQLSTTIDVSSISDKFPLGTLYGSIVGTGEYAGITGINIINSKTLTVQGIENSYYGLFATIDSNAYIEYIEFSGEFNIGGESQENYAPLNSYVGIVAGENNGTLTNVGVSIDKSQVYLTGGYVGGVVGINNGTILQDYSLFEGDDSINRSMTKSQLESAGRYSYAGMNPNILVYMNGTLTVSYMTGRYNCNTFIGGVSGFNNGIIKKIDTKVLTFTGYSNYMAFSLIQANPVSTQEGMGINESYVGGLVGVSSPTSSIESGYNINNGLVTYTKYYNYEGYNNNNDKVENSDNDYTAGQGIVVGGEVGGYDYIGGVVGYIETVGSNGININDFTGITTRTYVRGYLATALSTAKVAAIANIGNVSNLNTAYAIQAVDTGNSGINASMIILYNSSKVDNYFTNPDKNIANSNKLAFGLQSRVNIMCGAVGEESKNYTNVYTYTISREKIEMTEEEIADPNGKEVTSFNRTSYYGDFIIVGNNGERLLGQSFFTQGSEELLSINAKFNNDFIAEENNYQGVGNQKIYYMFYFQASTNGDLNSQDYQDLLDLYLNYVEFNSIIYPITTNGEMTLTSENRDILTIDQNGRINVKGTGLAKVTATSVLNANNALEFYIYVVNYFNPDVPSFTQQGVDDYEDNSIIYPNGSANSNPINDVTINMRGESSATFYVRPYYSLELTIQDNSGQEHLFKSDSTGTVFFNNIVFNLAQNNVVTAEVLNVSRYDETTDKYVDVTNDKVLDINITGQTITIRRNASTNEADYKLTIVTKLELDFTEIESENRTQVSIKYSSIVNKKLENVTINYRKGASSINNTKYSSVPLISSKKIEDTVVINSTALENNPYYYIVGPNNQLLQGSEELASIFGYEFIYTDAEDLFFNVKFSPNSNNGNNLSSQKFDLTISINKYSDYYENRYNQNIYGIYTVYIYAQSNTSIYTTLIINFEQTNILSISVDNYTNLSEATGTVGLSTTSENAIPGVTGLLAITISPDDSDFDYILIENADSNYQKGNAVASFGLVARNANTSGTNNDIFNDTTIAGSSTSKGLRLNLSDIIAIYNQKEGTENLYYSYNGVIYIKYDLGSYNVVDRSTTKIEISLVKGDQVYPVTKNLIVKLQNFVAVEIDGKESTSSNSNYYAHYNVARGLRYKLNINSYGYQLSSISSPTVDNEDLAKIVEENGVYYLEITSNPINYLDNRNSFKISISASQTEGEISRSSSSETLVTISEYVINYENDVQFNNLDIVNGMGNGEISIQVGTQFTFGIDIYDYIEYDSTITSVVNNINELMSNLSNQGKWVAYTNLITDTQPDYGIADYSENHINYELGYNTNGNAINVSNYYFTSSGLNIIPIRTHIPEERYYYFTYNSFITYNSTSGTYSVSVVDSSLNGININTEFVLNVYSSSSEESPLPIYDYDDLMDMQSDGYYILLNDITLPNTSDLESGVDAFTPISANFNSFDGNGHTINFAGTYDMGALSNIGLFTSLSEGSIIRNLNVNFTSVSDGSDTNMNDNDDYGWYGLRTVKFITSADSFNFGGIVVENNGIITNCNVTTDTVNGSEYYIVVKADNALSGTSYMAGIAALNSGYVTNCSVSVNMKSPYSMAGVVAQNSNKISASYFKEGKLINNSQQNQHIAGFVLTNLENGQIITSYVAGKPSNTSIYSKDKNSYIMSSISAAGFVYQNQGTISDCYTDIDLSQTTSDMAGFVYQNGGNIQNSFSLSILRNNVTASAGFARYNTLDNIQGQFKNCYYFYNENIGQSLNNDSYTNEDGFIYGEDNLNTSVIPINFEGVSRINAGGFANLSENFSSYAYQNSMSINGIWFYSTGNTSTTFIDYIPTTEKIEIPSNESENGQSTSENKNVQTNTVYTTQLTTFALNRLELVSANIDTLSIRNFSYSEIDESTGNVVYHYVDDINTPNRGSVHNPRLIYTAENMESEVTEQTSATGLNTAYYRIISDVDYSNYDALSTIYQTTYAGVIEGNGMEISQISLVSMDNLTNAGLFAQIGYSASKPGAVKNLTIIPKQVAFTNTNSVGTLAGTLNYGYLYDITVLDNINVTESEISELVVVGRNFVGGVIGRAIGYYDMKNITSSINTSATYTSTQNSMYEESSSSLSNYSYAGGIAGYLGSGNAYNLEAQKVGTIVGSRAGFAFGGIGNGAKIEYVYVNVMAGSRIRAYHYGGYVVGEIVGTLNHTQVYGNEEIESTFSVVPKSANAVGGIAGVLSGGTISNAVMEQSFRVTAISPSNTVVNSIGGIVGCVANAGNRISNIRNSIVNAEEIEGSSIVGGAVGQMTNALNIDGVAVKSESLSVTGEKADPYIGGIVGFLTSENNTMLSMINSYCISDIVIKTNTSGIASTASAGGLVGRAMRTPFLAYCYTTSTVNAEIVDLRSLDEITDYSVYLDGVVDDQNKKANFSYTNTNQYNGKEYSNVYYLGHNSFTGNGQSAQSYNVSKAYNIAFTTKVRNAVIGLAINNYGTSSLTYSQSSNISTQETSFYNLFNSTYYAPSASVNDENSPATVVYDSINDTYLLDNQILLNYSENNNYSNTSDITNYVTEEIKTQNYPNNLIIRGQLSTSTKQIIYIGESGEKYTYTNDGFVEETDIKNGNMNNTIELLPDGNYIVKTTHFISNISGVTRTLKLNDTTYTYERVNNVYVFKDNENNYLLDLVNNEGDIAKLTVTLNENQLSELVKQNLYTDGTNYYEHKYVFDEGSINEPFKEAYVDIVTGEVYYISDDFVVPNKLVWNCKQDSLSTLLFEENLDWLK